MNMKTTVFFALLCVLSLNLVSADNNQSMKSDQMIKKAHANKDYAKALELAEEALNQATMAVEQHNSQKDKYRFLDGYEKY